MQIGNEDVAKLVRLVEESTAATRRAEETTKLASNTTIKAIHSLERGQKILRRQVHTLWGRVIGGVPSEPPPGVDPDLTPPEKWSEPPIITMVDDARDTSQSNTAEIDQLRGEMIRGFAAMQTEMRAQQEVLSDQSDAMGIGKKGADFVFSKAGQRAILRTVTAVGALLAAFATMASACRSPAPPPSAPVAQQAAPTVIFLPAPTTSADAGATQ